MWAAIVEMFLPHVVISDERTGSEFNSDVGNLSIESGVGFLLSSDDDFKVVDLAVIGSNFETFRFWVSIIPNDTNCFLLGQTVGVVDKGPDTFDVTVVDVIDEVRVASDSVGSEVIEAETLPDGESSISEANICILLVLGHSGDDIPGRLLSNNKSFRVGSKESQPVAVTILFQILWEFVGSELLSEDGFDVPGRVLRLLISQFINWDVLACIAVLLLAHLIFEWIILLVVLVDLESSLAGVDLKQCDLA